MDLIKNISKISAIIFILFFTIISCNEKTPDNGMSNYITPETQEFEATTFENTSSISVSTMNKLNSYDEKTGFYTFDNESEGIEDLKPGTVVLFEGHSLRKIKSVRNEDGKIIVVTEFAKLTDYYKDAKISYNALIDWNDNSTGALNMDIGQPIATMGFSSLETIGKINKLTTIPSLVQNNNVKLKKEIKGWKVELTIEPTSEGKLKIKIDAKKNHLCSITAEGFISSFNSNANINIANGETQLFNYSNQDLKGEMEIKFSAVGLGSQIAILEIPAKIERTIMVNGVIPVKLTIKANLKIYPEVAVGSSSQVSMKLTYNSTAGFSYEGGRVKSVGDIRGENTEQTGDCNTATAGIAGMGVGIEFPRFEIGILGNVIVPYMVLNTHSYSYLSTGLLDNTPCHFAELKYNMHAGVSLNFLGAGSINNDYKVFEDKKRWIADGSHCD